jgi:hypothetical protein
VVMPSQDSLDHIAPSCRESRRAANLREEGNIHVLERPGHGPKCALRRVSSGGLLFPPSQWRSIFRESGWKLTGALHLGNCTYSAQVNTLMSHYCTPSSEGSDRHNGGATANLRANTEWYAICAAKQLATATSTPLGGEFRCCTFSSTCWSFSSRRIPVCSCCGPFRT